MSNFIKSIRPNLTQYNTLRMSLYHTYQQLMSTRVNWQCEWECHLYMLLLLLLFFNDSNFDLIEWPNASCNRAMHSRIAAAATVEI